MKRLGNSLRDLPPAVVIRFLRQAFSLPTGPARIVFNDILRPEKWHGQYTHRVRGNPEWWGAWIGEGINGLDEAALMKRVEDADIIMFYVHGGGFLMGRCTMFMDRYIEWLRCLKEKYNVNAMIMSVDSRLTSEGKQSSPVQDVVRAYKYLVKILNVDMSKVVAVGDSSGAGALLEMLMLTQSSSYSGIPHGVTNESATLVDAFPRPAAIVLSSPMTSRETDVPSWRENSKYDYITRQSVKILVREFFAADTPEKDRVLGINNVQEGFQNFMSPTLMFVGNREVLRDQALQLAAKAQKDGVPWETVLENYPHDWFCVREVVKDKLALRRADEVFAHFCYRHAVAKRHNQTMYEMTSYRRPSECFTVVLNEDDDGQDSDTSYDSDDDFRRSYATTDDFNSILTSLSDVSLDTSSTESLNSGYVI